MTAAVGRRTCGRAKSTRGGSYHLCQMDIYPQRPLSTCSQPPRSVLDKNKRLQTAPARQSGCSASTHRGGEEIKPADKEQGAKGSAVQGSQLGGSRAAGCVVAGSRRGEHALWASVGSGADGVEWRKGICAWIGGGEDWWGWSGRAAGASAAGQAPSGPAAHIRRRERRASGGFSSAPKGEERLRARRGRTGLGGPTTCIALRGVATTAEY